MLWHSLASFCLPGFPTTIQFFLSHCPHGVLDNLTLPIKVSHSCFHESHADLVTAFDVPISYLQMVSCPSMVHPRVLLLSIQIEGTTNRAVRKSSSQELWLIIANW